jgi:hypothetical protein
VYTVKNCGKWRNIALGGGTYKIYICILQYVSDLGLSTSNSPQEVDFFTVYSLAYLAAGGAIYA